ncbi:methanethiol S-methyltransferase [Roseiterribacter gracilis]|uniref:methanethiol S-methyltransferase n=1 Tax=Roseiterribacter gracilis TaxID=2812848 RepID=A0A8S8XDS0_9PROT|nr:membrane protein [Rhodospirillales bacterium TMPK1]
MARVAIFLYGIACYAVSLVVFIYGAGFFVGFGTPTMLDGTPTRPFTEALAINVGLLAAFAIQHSGMARPGFKRWWTRFVPESAERSTYLLFSNIAMVAIYYYWAPMGGVIWKVPEGNAYIAVLALYGFGWALLLLATFLINHFDLFGLEQVWRKLTGRTDRVQKFHTPLLYKLVRHPIYVGWLIIFWAAPVMTGAHLVFALGLTIYILIAIRLEERDLIDAFGKQYTDYIDRTPMLVPGLRRR